MTKAHVREICLSLPHATEHVQWGNGLVFKVAGKMFAVSSLDPGPVFVAFKCTAEDFSALIERPGVTPAPYLARAQWVAVEAENTLPRRELEPLLRKAHQTVAARLPQKDRSRLGL
jgi:predicted DNA-binding protein (MmcQ/YjbR family)